VRAFLIFMIQLVCVASLSAQSSGVLPTQNFEELGQKIESLFKQKDTVKALKYFRMYTQKARAEQNIEELVYIYRSMAIWQSALDVKLQYADSAIAIAQNSKNNELIGSAIYTKGVSYYKYNDWDKSLEHYLLSDEYIRLTDNKYLEHKIKYAIGQAAYRLGDYQQALNNTEACVVYFATQNDEKHQKGYLSSLQLLGILHNRLGNYQKCSEINELGLKKAKEYAESKMEIRFINSEAINKYHLGFYRESIEALQTYLPDFIQQENDIQQMLSWFFMGKNYIALGENSKAIPCFEKVDALFAQYGYLRDDMAENYYYLIEDAQQKGDLKRELYYTNRLIEAEKLLSQQYKNIAVRIKKYDTQNLLASKERVENALIQKEARNKWLIVLVSMITIGLLFVAIRHIRYKRKFEVLYKQFIEAQKERNKPALEPVLSVATETEPSPSTLEIKEEVINKILKKLEQFEANKEFIKDDLTMAKLAKTMKTNVKYLSRVIQDYKQKDYIRYINDLRIDYLTEMLQSQKYLNYSIEGYAKELGFSSAKGFNRAFEESTGMKFSYFLKKYQKEDFEQLAKPA
jgi:AraC-like DNA-binding protein